jgi:ABC-type Mn2+/Zn2+ transport system permease subunit
MLGPFELPFMQRAALEVVLLAPLAGLLGAQIVLRHLAFFTHGVGVAAFPGLVVAGPAGIPPLLAALGVGGAFAGLLERLGRRRGLSHDVATALLLVFCLALGSVLASDVFESGSAVDQLLFGSLLAIGSDELVASGLALALALGASLVARRAWIASAFEPESGGSLGLRVVAADWALVAAIALAAISSLDAVGALLVSGMLVIPAATARLFATSVPALELGAGALALVQGLGGLLIAYELDVPPGGAIAVLGGATFALCLLARALLARRSRSPEAA